MPGAPYADWRVLHVVGADRDAADPYLPYARKLLGHVMGSALFSDKIVRTLQDGTVVIAEKIGTIPRLTIQPAPPGPGKKPVTLFRDFVTWLEQDGEHYDPILLVPDNDKDPDASGVREYTGTAEWKSYFYSDKSAGYNDVDADARGAYVGTWPRGLENAGRGSDAGDYGWFVTCWENARGETLAIRQASRHFVNKYMHPSLHYSTRVVHCGMTCLDLETFDFAGTDLSSGYVVLGAAFKDMKLYVVVGLLAAITFDVPVGAPANFAEIFQTPVYGEDSNNFGVFRFELAPTTDPASGLTYYKAIARSDIGLAYFTNTAGTGLYAPWVFNEDVTEAYTYSIPTSSSGKVIARYSSTADDWKDGPEYYNVTGFTPSNGAYRISVAIDSEAGTASASSAVVTEAIAESCAGDVLYLKYVAADEFRYQLGEHTYTAVKFVGNGETVGDSMTINTLIDADLKRGVLMFREVVITRANADNFYSSMDKAVALVIVRDGQEVQRKATAEVSTINATGASIVYHGQLTNNAYDLIGAKKLFTYFAENGMAGLQVLYANPAYLAYEAVGASILAVTKFLYGEPLMLIASGFNASEGGRYSLTGGAAYGRCGYVYPDYTADTEISTLTWYTDFHGKGGAIDKLPSSGVVNGVQVESEFCANDIAEIGLIAPSTWAPDVAYDDSDYLKVGTALDDWSDVLGDASPLSFSLLGRPCLQQELEMPA